jgi:hypothetical protein
MRRAGGVVLLLALVGSCRSLPDDGYAVDLTLQLDGSVSEAERQTIRVLAVAVAGAEHNAMTFALVNPFGDGRAERVTYRPAVPSGSLTFYAAARDGQGDDVAGGNTQVQLQPGATAFATVVLSRVAAPTSDGGEDGASGDGAVQSCGPNDDGRVCGAGDPCHDPPTCFGGLCVPTLKPDGAQCGAGDACHAPPTCSAGQCGAPPPLSDGTVCNSGDACHLPSTCSAGTCGTPAVKADGTVCASTKDPCMTAGTCMAGVCSGAGTKPDGTSCGTAPDACHSAPVCKAGACQPPASKADGAVCNSTSNPCQNPGTCKSGACGAITNAMDGKVCSNPVDLCHTAGVCKNGACGAQGVLPTGTSYDGVYSHRCCGGLLVDIATDASNCGACGIKCFTGLACVHAGTNPDAYYCRCTSALDCWSGCCSTAFGVTQDVCAASTCPEPSGCAVPCPGGATCLADGMESAFCHY